VSLLWITLGLILGIDIRLDDAGGGTGMVRRGLPGTVHQFHPLQLLENDATPILRRTYRSETALALSTILITEHTLLAEAVAAQPMRAKQTVTLFVNGADRLFVRNRRPNQAVHVFHRLDLGFDNAHSLFTIPRGDATQRDSTLYNTVVLEKVKEILATLERMDSPLSEVLRKRLVERAGGR